MTVNAFPRLLPDPECSQGSAVFQDHPANRWDCSASLVPWIRFRTNCRAEEVQDRGPEDTLKTLSSQIPTSGAATVSAMNGHGLKWAGEMILRKAKRGRGGEDHHKQRSTFSMRVMSHFRRDQLEWLQAMTSISWFLPSAPITWDGLMLVYWPRDLFLQCLWRMKIQTVCRQLCRLDQFLKSRILEASDYLNL